MRRAANIDRTHALIVNAFRGMGATVLSLAKVGQGCPDLLVGVAGRNLLVEVKSFPAHTEKGKLNPEQQQWHDAWRGQVCVVRSVDDAVALVKNIRILTAYLQDDNLSHAV